MNLRGVVRSVVHDVCWTYLALSFGDAACWQLQPREGGPRIEGVHGPEPADAAVRTSGGCDGRGHVVPALVPVGVRQRGDDERARRGFPRVDVREREEKDVG